MAHHAPGIEETLHAESVAVGAGADRTVEREQPRLQFRYPVTAHRTRELPREHQGRLPGLVHEADLGHAIRQRERGLERLGQAQAHLRAHPQPVHHGLDGVVVVAVQRRGVVQVADGPVDAHAHESAGPEVGEHIGVGSLAGGHHGRQHHDARALLQA